MVVDSVFYDIHESDDLASAKSRSSRADSGLRVAFACLNGCHCPGCLAGGI